MTDAHVTAITVTYRTGPVLRDCLAALLADPDITQTIVVDNGNPPYDRAWLEAFAEETEAVRLITPGRNLGFGAGVNLAARQARDGYLLLINPDAVLEPGAVPALIAPLAALDRPRIAGGRIHDASGQECRGARRRELTLWRALTTFCGWNTWTLEHTPPPDAPVLMDAVSGAFMLTDTDSFARLGGFDEAYFLHVEDIDLCRRAWAGGGAVVYCPGAGALHHGSTSDVPSRTVAGYKADSLAHYFRKFSGNPLTRLFAGLVISPVLRAAFLARARD